MTSLGVSEMDKMGLLLVELSCNGVLFLPFGYLLMELGAMALAGICVQGLLAGVQEKDFVQPPGLCEPGTCGFVPPSPL